MVGESFVNRAIGRPVNQPNPVDECVLGTRVLGNSFISGSVFADLVPFDNGVSVRLTLSGNFSSDNIGYNRGVKVYTKGYSPIYASKIISITPTGTRRRSRRGQYQSPNADEWNRSPLADRSSHCNSQSGRAKARGQCDWPISFAVLGSQAVRMTRLNSNWPKAAVD